ncbi:hypothetical protein [Scytonema sp. NUACC26]
MLLILEFNLTVRSRTIERSETRATDLEAKQISLYFLNVLIF